MISLSIPFLVNTLDPFNDKKVLPEWIIVSGFVTGIASLVRVLFSYVQAIFTQKYWPNDNQGHFSIPGGGCRNHNFRCAEPKSGLEIFILKLFYGAALRALDPCQMAAAHIIVALTVLFFCGTTRI